MQDQWTVVYTQAKHEKKVAEKLIQKKIEHYLPVIVENRKWSDRIKKIEVPLFASYLFVKISADQYSQIREIPGVVNFVYQVGKPATISLEEINAIKLFIRDYFDPRVMVNTIGQRFKIESGIFKGYDAITKRILKTKIILDVPVLGISIIIKKENKNAES